MTVPVTCVIVDDHDMMRLGARVQLSDHQDIEVIGESRDGENALEQISHLNPDVAIVDMRLPGCSGIDVAQKLSDQGCPTKIIIFSAYSSATLAEKAIAAGAWGFVSKDSPADNLAAAVRVCSTGRHYLDPALASQMLLNRGGGLTEREIEILTLMSEGEANPEIAENLGLSTETVKSHVSKILSKMGAESRTHAVAMALRSSLIS